MGIHSLASYLIIKYAQQLPQPDVSFGEPVSPEKTTLLKGKLSDLARYITGLPDFKQVEKEIGNDELFEAVKASLDLYSATVESQTLKENFLFFIKVLMNLNRVRDNLVKRKVDRRVMHTLDPLIKRIQDYIWEHTKALIHLHDLRGVNLNALMPETVGALRQRIIPTWAYGPMRNPAKKLLVKQPHHPYRDLMQRLEKEMQEEEKHKPKGNQ